MVVVVVLVVVMMVHSNGDHGSRLSQTRTATESLPNPDGSKHLLSRKNLGNLLGFLSSQPSTQHLRLIAQGVGVVVAREVVRAATALLPAAGVARCSLQGLAAEQAVK